MRAAAEKKRIVSLAEGTRGGAVRGMCLNGWGFYTVGAAPGTHGFFNPWEIENK